MSAVVLLSGFAASTTNCNTKKAETTEKAGFTCSTGRFQKKTHVGNWYPVGVKQTITWQWR